MISGHSLTAVLIFSKKSVQLKADHLMDLVHLVLESVVFLPCHAEGVLVRIRHI